MIFLELKIHIFFPFSFLSKLLTTHPVSILKAEVMKSVFMCVMPYIIGRKYFIIIPPYKKSEFSVVMQNCYLQKCFCLLYVLVQLQEAWKAVERKIC